ncbi:hypothetical protein [Cyclobacterium xiamenense]|uniref:hypothetical protein n=1 Tax=Cyclobacterium xiamenense TaxID=1297121 RepID=UPI0035D11462
MASTYRRDRAVRAVLLAYFFSLSCHVVFVHSHWKEGRLVALHAHPYDFGSDGGERKKKDTHSDKEYELYKLIFTSPLLELGLEEVIIAWSTQTMPLLPAVLSDVFNDWFPASCSVRGPPSFASVFSMPLFR